LKATIKLDRLDIEYLLSGIDKNIEKGWYYGNKLHFFKRLYRLRANLAKALLNISESCIKEED
jgi:hypothetical protein